MDPILLKSLEISLAAALPFGIEKTIRWHLRRKKLDYLSYVFPISDEDHSMTVKCSVWRTKGGKDPKTVRGYVHSAEALALKNVASKLEPLGVKLDLRSFYGPPTGATKLLLIGSGAYIEDSKAVMRRQLGEYSCVFPDDEHFYFQLPDRPPFKCVHKKQGQDLQAFTDYGLIARKRVAEKDILLLAGIHMHGTLGAAEVSLSKEFQVEVKKKKFPFFAQMVRVDVEQKLGLDVTSIHWRDYPLCRVVET